MRFLQKIQKRYFSVAFLFTVVWEIATKTNYVEIFAELKLNRHTVLAQQTNKLRLRESLQTDTRSCV